MKISCLPALFEGCSGVPRVDLEISGDIGDLIDIELKIAPDYYTSFRRPISNPIAASARDYLLGCSGLWQEGWLCPEMAVPKALGRITRLILPQGASWKTEATAFLHAGRPGCIAPLHFDWDHSWVAHACLMGRKKMFFLPPSAGWMLNPIINTSALCIPKMENLDREELMRQLGGFEVVLEAGQGVVFPSMYWHGVLYESSSLAISARFQSIAGGRPFGALPRSWLLQRLLWIFFKEGYGTKASEFLLLYLKEFFLKRDNWRHRYLRMNTLCRGILSEYGERRGVLELSGENFSAELALAAQELKNYYSCVARAEAAQINSDVVQGAFVYLFDDIPCEDRSLGICLATYAVRVREGLPPRRGIIRVVDQGDL